MEKEVEAAIFQVGNTVVGVDETSLIILKNYIQYTWMRLHSYSKYVLMRDIIQRDLKLLFDIFYQNLANKL